MPSTIDTLLVLIALSPSVIFLYWYLFHAQTPRKSLNTIVSVETKKINQERNTHIAYYNRGLAYLKLGKPRRAIDDITEALKLNPDYGVAYNVRGNAYIKLQLYNEALQDYSKAIKIDPHDWQSYYNRSRLYYYFMTEYDLAFNDAIKSIDLAPSDPGGYLIVGYIFHKQGNNKESLAYLEKYADLEDEKIPSSVSNLIMHLKRISETEYV